MVFNHETSLFDLLMFVCLVKIGLYYCLPAVTHLISGWKPVYAERVAPLEVTTVYIIEFFSYLIYIYTIQIYIQKRHPRITITQSKTSRLFVFILLVLSLLEYIDSASLLGDSKSSLESFWFIVPFVRNCGIFLVLYILVIGAETFGLVTVLFSIVTLLGYLAFAITAGVRSLLVWPILFFMYFSYKYARKKLKIFLPIGIAATVLMMVFQGALVDMRGQDVSAAGKLSKMESSNNLGKLFNEVDYRFGAMTTYGVGYVRLYKQGKSAGLNPIINSLYAPVPRSLFKDKPVACSYDGTKEGQGMYMATAAASKFVNIGMTEPATGAHAYWEIGLLGIVLFSIISALYVMLCMSSFRGFGMLAVPLFMVIFKLEYLEPKLWVSCIILQLVQVNIPAFFLKKIYLKMGNPKNNLHHEKGKTLLVR